MKEELVERIAKVMDTAMGEGWHYSDYGTYYSYDELPETLKDMLRQATHKVVEIIEGLPQQYDH